MQQPALTHALQAHQEVKRAGGNRDSRCRLSLPGGFRPPQHQAHQTALRLAHSGCRAASSSTTEQSSVKPHACPCRLLQPGGLRLASHAGIETAPRLVLARCCCWGLKTAQHASPGLPSACSYKLLSGLRLSAKAPACPQLAPAGCWPARVLVNLPLQAVAAGRPQGGAQEAVHSQRDGGLQGAPAPVRIGLLRGRQLPAHGSGQAHLSGEHFLLALLTAIKSMQVGQNIVEVALWMALLTAASAWVWRSNF